MSLFEENLEYAKKVVKIRDAFLAGEFDDYGYLKVSDTGSRRVYTYTLDKNVAFKVCKYEAYKSTTFQSGLKSKHYRLVHHNTPEYIILNEGSIVNASDVSVTEEFNFQNSLVYADAECKELMTFAYLLQHPMPEEYRYFEMNMYYLEEMDKILTRLRHKKALAENIECTVVPNKKEAKTNE